MTDDIDRAVDKALESFELAIVADGNDTVMLLKRAARRLPDDDPLRKQIIAHLRKIDAMQPLRDGGLTQCDMHEDESR